VGEHVLVAERALGHILPRSAVIHHVDEQKSNNAAGNLVICQDQAYHNLIHRRQRALDACGDASAIRCGYCGGYDRQGSMKLHRNRYGHAAYGRHEDCIVARNRQRFTHDGASA